MWSKIYEDLPKTFLAVFISALGFFCALAINSYLDGKREREAYRSTVAGIRYEASANRTIIQADYRKYFMKGVVLKDFNSSVVVQAFANPLFMKFVQPQDMALLNRYSQELILANSYRRVAETLTLTEPPHYEEWLQPVYREWSATITSLAVDTCKVERIGAAAGGNSGC